VELHDFGRRDKADDILSTFAEKEKKREHQSKEAALLSNQNDPINSQPHASTCFI
jgi:hypothetical protein